MNLVNLVILLVVFASVVGLGHPIGGFMSSFLAITGFRAWRFRQISFASPELQALQRATLRATLLGLAVWLVLFAGVVVAGW